MLKLAYAIAALALAFTSPASAMTVDVLQQGGQSFVHASGEIEQGDAQLIAAAFAQVASSSHNTKLLYLDSLGGSVTDAFAVAKLVKKTGVTTVISSSAVCASACASIIFISGKYRIVQNGGSLVIHSCYDSNTNQKVDACNEQIAARAQQQGISGRAMRVFEDAAPTPDSGVSFGAAEAACYGLSRAPGQAALGDNAPCVKKLYAMAANGTAPAGIGRGY